VVMNTSKDIKDVSPAKYFERSNGFSKMRDVVTGEVSRLTDFSVDAKRSVVYELLKQ
jgi:neopullulanase